MVLKYLLQKEWLQIRRNSFLPRLILTYPIMLMCVMPWVMNMEVKNIAVAVVDNDHSARSQQTATFGSWAKHPLMTLRCAMWSNRAWMVWWSFRKGLPKTCNKGTHPTCWWLQMR